MVKYLGQPTLEEWRQINVQLAAARSALEFYAEPKRYQGANQRPIPNDPHAPQGAAYLHDVTRDNGDIARATLSTLAQEPAGQSEADNMAGVAEQSGAGAPETSVRCGAPAASNTGKPVAYMTAYGFDNWMAGDGPESHVLMRGEGVGLPRVALYADARPVEWECLGRKQTLPEPGDCNWPDCGCDAHATKVIESLVEQGWQPAAPAGSASPGGTAGPSEVDGINGCLSVIPKALRYLADNDRPTGGNDHFNSEHLYQLADELERTTLPREKSA